MESHHEGLDQTPPPGLMGAETFLCCRWTLALSHPKVQQEKYGTPLSLDPWVIPGSKQSHGMWFDTKCWHPKKPPDPWRRQCCLSSQEACTLSGQRPVETVKY